MAKIENDKYYSPQHIVDLVIQRTKDVIGLDNITEFIEPSAGNGAFLDKLYELGKPVYAYDLYPERDDIKEQDYLKLDLDYKKGRCIIGNPPFGKGNTLSVKFYKKSITFSDYIVFILPISQLNNNQQMYEYDLIHSEDLGKKEYSNISLNCCLNIYKKNNNQKPNFKLKDVEIRQSRKRGGIVPNIDIKKYDIAICIRGEVGKICYSLDEYNDIILLKCLNEKFKDRIIKSICNIKPYFTKDISTQSIKTWQVYKYLKEQIPELE